MMNSHMNKSFRNWLVLIIVIVAAVLASLWVTSFPPPFVERVPRQVNPADIELYYNVETIVSVVNVTLSTLLLITYANIYIKTRSEFTVGLMILSAVLLLHSFVAIPFVQHAFGFFEFGLGPFAMLPDLFTCAALAILLYFTFQY